MLVCRFLTLTMILFCTMPLLSGCGSSNKPGVATGKDEEPVPLTKEQEDVELKNQKDFGGR